MFNLSESSMKDIPQLNAQKSYIAPTVEILEIQVEKGFANSSSSSPWEDGGNW